MSEVKTWGNSNPLSLWGMKWEAQIGLEGQACPGLTCLVGVRLVRALRLVVSVMSMVC